MQTRSQKRKFADTIASARDAAGAPIAPIKMVQTPTVTNNSGSGASSRSVSKTKRGGMKRKRTGKKAQPVKGGWVLPHGMGAGVAGLDAGSSQSTESTARISHVADLSIVASSPTGVSPPASQQPGVKATQGQARQTRLSLRLSKVGVTGQARTSEGQEPAVNLENLDSPSIKQEQDDVRPHKRLRITLLTTGKASAVASDKGERGVIRVKVEEKDTPNQLIPKLLIIKGITFKDGVVMKTLDRVIVDASKILDPNFKLTLKRGKENPYGLTPGFSPYPYRRVPTPEACEEVHRILTELHGEVKQPEKMPPASLEVAGCGEVPCVLDALLRTLISGNTLMAMADSAIKNLAEHYGLQQEGTGAGSINWEKVRLSSHRELVQVIRVAGNGPKKASHIKQILDIVYKENLERVKQQAIAAADTAEGGNKAGMATQDLLSLDYMHNMSKDEAMAKFVSYPGIGIKTAACVTLFCLRLPCFAVDTHVHKFCRWLGWVPEKADPDNCFRHGDFMVPDHLKYGLHQLFIRHGQQCFKCRKATKPGTKDWEEAPDCPLEHLLDRSKDEVTPKAKPKRRVKETSSDTDDPEEETTLDTDSSLSDVDEDGEEEEEDE
ncbi:DNA glycosylase [Achaetomium macrosporum]|uniref:DNA glycosylase n=1 Tax=Achaetomium macrosporum TaxID=79813 RepID=A0AAN7C6J2_9PEZI|nr:DNA glycosylase [Achaetomium macrosporum]